MEADGIVDLADLADLVSCLTEPCPTPVCDSPLDTDSCCALLDSEPDGDVDPLDIAAFWAAFTGSP